MRTIAVLGSTGSVGVTTLDVAARFPERFRVAALAAGRNLELLAQQIARFKPEVVAVADEAAARALRATLSGQRPLVLTGLEGAVEVATHPAAELVVSALVGALGLKPTLRAIESGKDIAFANKEVLVMAGEIVTRAALAAGVRLLPVDSEHNALFQCLEGRARESVKRIILTASGGPFRTWSREQMEEATVVQALNHPIWNMGHKITIDSATLMNKGLEVIEAHWLFGLSAERIDVVIHPQGVVHSLVELVDGSVLAELAIADMAIPAAFALAYPERLPLGHLRPLSLFQAGPLTFEPPDLERFPCLRLAYQALASGGTTPACLNGANEELVAGFLAGRLRFAEIWRHLATILERYSSQPARTLEDVLQADSWGRAAAHELMAA
ncbi:MAG TPA: 1-deoxy-D-xylulose-5-phosphate reductoisomerase [Candidatus Binataceae bacterium]|nr:1-deoxy-D-xylulose-5-phosphate reductoisomerase [Candidatus Binataceae bacterium]